jgi:hypothetical protein
MENSHARAVTRRSACLQRKDMVYNATNEWPHHQPLWRKEAFVSIWLDMVFDKVISLALAHRRTYLVQRGLPVFNLHRTFPEEHGPHSHTNQETTDWCPCWQRSEKTPTNQCTIFSHFKEMSPLTAEASWPRLLHAPFWIHGFLLLSDYIADIYYSPSIAQ